MKYDNSVVRRQNRLLSEVEAMTLLAHGAYGFLALVSEDQTGYGVPMSYVFHQEAIYFHCAMEGEKLRSLAKNNQVSFCVVGETKVIPDQFTTAYESVLVKGTMVLDLSDQEKLLACMLLIEKYAPDDQVQGMQYAQKSSPRTCVMRLDITSVSGKCRRL